jgi:hypothetical protein
MMVVEGKEGPGVGALLDREMYGEMAWQMAV